MAYLYHWLATMSFSARVNSLRKQKGLTQQGLADTSGIHVQQIKRYEAGHAQPTAEALKRLALALHVTSDALLRHCRPIPIKYLQLCAIKNTKILYF